MVTPSFCILQERRIKPGEALNHAFVRLAHLLDYAHCNNVKASVQMMEVCRRSGFSTDNNHQATQPPLVANFVPSSNGNVTLTFNNQLTTNQVQRLVRERTSGYDNLVCFCSAFHDLVDEFKNVIWFAVLQAMCMQEF